MYIDQQIWHVELNINGYSKTNMPISNKIPKILDQHINPLKFKTMSLFGKCFHGLFDVAKYLVLLIKLLNFNLCTTTAILYMSFPTKPMWVL